METEPNRISEQPSRMIIVEHVMPTREIFNLLARVCHDTWLRQRRDYKGIPIEQGPSEVSDDDHTRAKGAWWALTEGKPKTKEEAVTLIAESSHQIWLEGQKDRDNLDQNPNAHDTERARDLIQALEDSGVVVFR